MGPRSLLARLVLESRLKVRGLKWVHEAEIEVG